MAAPPAEPTTNVLSSWYLFLPVDGDGNDFTRRCRVAPDDVVAPHNVFGQQHLSAPHGVESQARIAPHDIAAGGQHDLFQRGAIDYRRRERIFGGGDGIAIVERGPDIQ